MTQSQTIEQIDFSKLSAEDRRIIEIEKEIQHLQKAYTKDNITHECCNTLHSKATSLLKEQCALIYDSNGNYRKDKRHLLQYIEGNEL